MPRWDDPLFLVSGDTEWQARLRALQSWYREDVLQIEAGRDLGDKIRGNFLPASAPRGLNFLTPEISQFVEEWLPEANKAGALVDEDRLWRNMLSSMPLAFNLFVPLRNDLALASGVFRQVTAGRVSRVTGIAWEYSPGRGDPRYTNDGTAFDVFVTFVAESGGPGFIGIELKYHEDLRRDKKAKDSERYLQIAEEMNCFHASKLTQLHDPPLGQIWRNHLLAGSLQIESQFQDSFLVVLYPSVNLVCRQAVQDYRDYLSEPRTFEAWHLEQFADAITGISTSAWIDSFRERYLNFGIAAEMGG